MYFAHTYQYAMAFQKKEKKNETGDKYVMRSLQLKRMIQHSCMASHSGCYALLSFQQCFRGFRRETNATNPQILRIYEHSVVAIYLQPTEMSTKSDNLM